MSEELVDEEDSGETEGEEGGTATEGNPGGEGLVETIAVFVDGQMEELRKDALEKRFEVAMAVGMVVWVHPGGILTC